MCTSSGLAAADYYRYIIGWVEDELQILTRRAEVTEEGMELRVVLPRMRVEDPSWEFENHDDDEALELVQLEQYSDNWLCHRTVEVIYDWDGMFYIMSEPTETWSEDVNCALRRAEQAMYAHNYELAVQEYELALARYKALTEPSTLITQFATYAEERLVIAYALSGHMDEALGLIEQIDIESPPEQTIAHALVNAVSDGVTAYKLCQAAYQAAEQYAPYAYSAGQGYRGLPAVGLVDDQYFGWVFAGRGPSTQVGCDINHLRDERISNSVYTLEMTPLQPLEALDITTEGATTLHPDLNNDSHEEWIIWLTEDYKPWFFSSTDEAYIVSRITGTFPKPEGAGVQVYLLPLPNGELAWLTRPSDTAIHIAPCTFYNGDSFSDAGVAPLYIWQLRDHQLIVTTHLYQCSNDPISTLLGDNGEIRAWTIALEGADYYSTLHPTFHPATFIWDENSSQYIVESDTSVTPTARPTPPADLAVAPNLGSVHAAVLFNADYEAAVEMADYLLQTSQTETQLLRYLRALALEALNRPDEALAEYVAIYESAPDSAWGQLAALHLERVAN